MKRKMFFEANPLLFQQAKYLRNHLTNAEMKLWGYLRTRPMGYKFRRQHPIGIYIVDFYCHPLKLVIEADGNIHDKQDVQQADKERQQSLESDGLQVIRFSNHAILKNTEYVIEQINIILTNKSIPPLGG
jgi:cyclase